MPNYCPKCGTQTRPNARYCGGCGHDISQSAPSVQSPPAGSSAGSAPQAPQPYVPPANLQPYQPPAQSWPDAYSAVQPTPPAYSAQDPGQGPSGGKSTWERKALLAQQLQQEVARGGRVDSQNDTMAVVVTGKPVNHILHFLITLFTAGLWIPIWIIVAATGGEKRKMITVDEFGNVQIQKA